MSSNVYFDKGDSVRVTASFTDFSDAPVDPNTVTLKYHASGDTTTLTYPTGITKTSTGNYRADVELDESGSWWFRWEGDGATPAASETVIEVRHSKFD